MIAVQRFKQCNDATRSSQDSIIHGYHTRGLKPSAELRLFQTFEICSNERQSDRGVLGGGVVAKVAVKKGEIFEDKGPFWLLGTPPSNLDRDRGEYIMYGEGYFIVQGSYTVMLNETRGNKPHNMQFKVFCTDHDGGTVKTLGWEFLCNVQVDKEILIQYYQISAM